MKLNTEKAQPIMSTHKLDFAYCKLTKNNLYVYLMILYTAVL